MSISSIEGTQFDIQGPVPSNASEINPSGLTSQTQGQTSFHTRPSARGGARKGAGRPRKYQTHEEGLAALRVRRKAQREAKRLAAKSIIQSDDGDSTITGQSNSSDSDVATAAALGSALAAADSGTASHLQPLPPNMASGAEFIDPILRYSHGEEHHEQSADSFFRSFDSVDPGQPLKKTNGKRGGARKGAGRKKKYQSPEEAKLAIKLSNRASVQRGRLKRKMREEAVARGEQYESPEPSLKLDRQQSRRLPTLTDQQTERAVVGGPWPANGLVDPSLTEIDDFQSTEDDLARRLTHALGQDERSGSLSEPERLTISNFTSLQWNPVPDQAPSANNRTAALIQLSKAANAAMEGAQPSLAALRESKLRTRKGRPNANKVPQNAGALEPSNTEALGSLYSSEMVFIRDYGARQLQRSVPLTDFVPRSGHGQIPSYEQFLRIIRKNGPSGIAFDEQIEYFELSLISKIPCTMDDKIWRIVDEGDWNKTMWEFTEWLCSNLDNLASIRCYLRNR